MRILKRNQAARRTGHGNDDTNKGHARRGDGTHAVQRAEDAGPMMPEKCQHGLAIGACACSRPALAVGQTPTTTQASERPITIVALPATNNAAPQGTMTSGDSSPPGWVGGTVCSPGCYPRECTASLYAVALREHAWRKQPYTDPLYDYCNMSPIYSDFVDVEPGETVEIQISPRNGTMAAYYYTIVAVDPDTGVDTVDYTYRQPYVDGCPVPCSSGDQDILPKFGEHVPDACCGTPLTAWLDRRSEDVPLNIPVTNNQANGNIRFQVEVRGYCCSTRICAT
jgi:hypothetical protein